MYLLLNVEFTKKRSQSTLGILESAIDSDQLTFNLPQRKTEIQKKERNSKERKKFKTSVFVCIASSSNSNFEIGLFLEKIFYTTINVSLGWNKHHFLQKQRIQSITLSHPYQANLNQNQ